MRHRRRVTQELTRYTSPEEVCPYLHDRPSRLEYRVILDLQPTTWDAMLARGWRRFGPVYFRPVCQGCLHCVSLRIPVARHQASKSQRRLMRKAERFQVRMNVPRCDRERLELYGRWHANREATRDWKSNPLTPEQYEKEFCFPQATSQEMAWYDEDRLIAIDLVDITPRSLSSIFFFFDPDYAAWSPGIASVLLEVALARRLGLEHIYLGYRVHGCYSMAYKSRFQPHELLEGRPELEETPHWVEG